MKYNIMFFYIYRISSRLYFHLAVLFVYFYIHDIDVFKIELLLASYGIMLMISSSWKSKLSRKLSEKNIIIMGDSLKLLGLICLMFNSSTPLLLIGQLLSGIGYSLTSGTDSIILKNMLKDEDSKYNKIESSTNSIMFISFLFAGIVGSILFSINQYYIFYFSMLSNVISIISIMSIKNISEKNIDLHSKEEKETNLYQINENQMIKFWRGYYAISRAFPLSIFVGFLPYMLFVKVEINLYFFGFVLSLFTLGGFLAARFFNTLTKRFNFKIITLSTMILCGVSMLLLGLVNNIYITLIVVFLLGLASGGVRPLTITQLNTNKIPSYQRIKLFSSMEKLYGLWNALLLIIGGILLEFVGFQYLMVCFTCLYTILVVFFYSKYSIKENKFKITL